MMDFDSKHEDFLVWFSIHVLCYILWDFVLYGNITQGSLQPNGK